MYSLPETARPQPGWRGRTELLLLFLRRIALFAGLAFLLGLDAALVLAVLAGGFRLVAAGFRTYDSHAAQENEGADDCTDGLHVSSFLAARLRRRSLVVLCLEPIETAKRLSLAVRWLNYRRTIVAVPGLTTQNYPHATLATDQPAKGQRS